jgi:hypothetical protein
MGVMRSKTGLWLVVCGCAVLTACTTAPPKGPDASVTPPAVGRPAPPASEAAALDSEAFTPYADIGASSSDGLALGDTYQALGTACMTAAGYGQYANDTSFFFRANNGLGFPQDFGPWGYIGLSAAQQYGFMVPGRLLAGPVGPSPSGLPAGAQTAEGKCGNIVSDFNDAMFAGALAGIETMNNEISNDAVNDADFKQAMVAWSACMAKNGYTAPNADDFALDELDALGLREITPGSSGPSTPTAAQTREQIAMAVTDADCTLSSDLGGIYFAVQASYEQQFVNANQQALNVAVREYKADFAKELSKLPALLRTVSATPALPAFKGGKPPHGHFVKPGVTPSPSPTRSAG